jgi:putative polyhydroxyalkanoate system protein
MANIHIKQRHNLAHDEARKRVEDIARDLKKKLNADYAWKGESLKFKRSGASGSIDLSEEYIELNIKLGMMLAPMKSKIESAIKEKLHLALQDNQNTKLT